MGSCFSAGHDGRRPASPSFAAGHHAALDDFSLLPGRVSGSAHRQIPESSVDCNHGWHVLHDLPVPLADDFHAGQSHRQSANTHSVARFVDTVRAYVRDYYRGLHRSFCAF